MVWHMRGKDISNLYYRGIGGKPDLEQYIINNVCTFQLVLSNSKQQVPGERRKKRSNCLQGTKLPVGKRKTRLENRMPSYYP